MKLSRRNVLHGTLGLLVGSVFGECSSDTPSSGTGETVSLKDFSDIQEFVSRSFKVPSGDLHRGFYPGSLTVELFFPDTHKKGYIEQQRTFVNSFSEAMRHLGHPLQALGLEGVAHGIQDSRMLSSLAKEREQEFAQAMRRSSQFIGLVSRYCAPLPPAEAAELQARAREANAHFQDQYLRSAAADAERSIARSYSPGVQYADLHPVVYGLEDFAWYERQLRKIGYVFHLETKRLLDSVIEKFSQSGGNADLHRIILQEWQEQLAVTVGHLELLDRNISSEYRDRCKAIVQNSTQEEIRSQKNLDAVVLEDLDFRTGHWVGAAPSKVKGFVGVIGGAVHVEPYERIAREKGQSYIILASPSILDKMKAKFFN